MKLRCNSTYRLRYWNSGNGFWCFTPVGKVATVLTVYGIETTWWLADFLDTIIPLQQYLPFTVLKQLIIHYRSIENSLSCNSTYRLRYWNANFSRLFLTLLDAVATVLTVYGIETNVSPISTLLRASSCNSTYRLRYWNNIIVDICVLVGILLQQYLPFTVLKLPLYLCFQGNLTMVATVLTVYGIETIYHYYLLLVLYHDMVATVLTVYGIETLVK